MFVRTVHPMEGLRVLHSAVFQQIRDAGVKPPGKCGLHIFEHARAVEMLRAPRSRKADRRYAGSSFDGIYAHALKRQPKTAGPLALDVPGSEVLS